MSDGGQMNDFDEHFETAVDVSMEDNSSMSFWGALFRLVAVAVALGVVIVIIALAIAAARLVV